MPLAPLRVSSPSSAGNYILTLLGSRGPSVEDYVMKALVAVLCRITKFAWLDGEGGGAKDYPIRNIVKDVQRFLQVRGEGRGGRQKEGEGGKVYVSVPTC